MNSPAYSPDITPFDYYLFSNLNKFVHGKKFSCDDETIDTVEDYLNKFDSEFFREGIQSLRDCWKRVIASESQYIE